MVFHVPEILLENGGERLGDLFRRNDGHVLSVDVIKSSPGRGGTATAARVTMASAEAARNAKELFDARPIDVTAFVPKSALVTRVEFEVLWFLRSPVLVLSDLSPEVEREELKAGLAQFGEIDDVEMLTSESARVIFKSRRAAARVLKLFARNLFIISGYPVPVRAAVAPGALGDEQLAGAAAFLCLDAAYESGAGSDCFISGASNSGSTSMRFPGVPKLTPHFAQAFSEEFDVALKFRRLQQLELAERRTLEQHHLKRRVRELQSSRESFTKLKGMIEMIETLKVKIISYGVADIARQDKEVAVGAAGGGGRQLSPGDGSSGAPGGWYGGGGSGSGSGSGGGGRGAGMGAGAGGGTGSGRAFMRRSSND